LIGKKIRWRCRNKNKGKCGIEDKIERDHRGNVNTGQKDGYAFGGKLKERGIKNIQKRQVFRTI